MATIRFTDADRDARGFIRLSPPPDATASAVETPALPPPLPMRRTAPVPAARVPMPRGLVVLISGGLIGMLLIGLTIHFGTVPQPIAPHATAAPVETAAPSPSPVARRPSIAPVAMLAAYGAPNGVLLGQVESTRAITPTAHYGGDWIQADVAGSGLVWLRAGDAPDLAIVGPDLAPRPTAVFVLATATPEPPPCAEAGIPGKMVEVCGYEDLASLEAQAKQQWIDQYGGNIGTVATPSPQVR
jgi:hypothetical protein